MRPDKYGMLTCSQCGEYHPKSNHRKYFPSQTKGEDRDSYYKQCKRCERINKRYIYLLKKDNKTEQDSRDISITETLYKELQARGFEVPSIGKGHKPKDESALALLNKVTNGKITGEVVMAPYSEAAKKIDDKFKGSPQELISMLYRDLHGCEPEALYQQYDALYTKYAPQIGIDDNYIPIHDQTHKEVLQQILKRIEEYEDGLF